MLDMIFHIQCLNIIQKKFSLISLTQKKIMHCDILIQYYFILYKVLEKTVFNSKKTVFICIFEQFLYKHSY